MKIKIIISIVGLAILLVCVMSLTLTTSVPFLAGTSQIKNETCKPIIVVYPTWYVEGFSATDIRWDLFSHLAVFAIYPLADGSLETTDADSTLAKVIDVAKAKGKKVIVSVGGAGEASKPFLSLSQNKDSQLKFVQAVTDYVAKHNLDGVDIDWEYWTFQNQLNKGGNDKTESLRLLNLLSQLRVTLPKNIMLSVDVFAGDWVGPQYLPEPKIPSIL